MADIVFAALTLKDMAEVSKANRAVVFEMLALLSLIGQEVHTLNVLHLELRLYLHIGNFFYAGLGRR